MTTIAITAGEPAGIGPDLIALLAAELSSRKDVRFLVLGDRDVLHARADALGVRLGALAIEHIPVARRVTPGTLAPENSAHVLALLDRAIAGCLGGEFAAMVTAPLHKGIINDAKLAAELFTGHTEYLATKVHANHAVMLLVGGGMRVALATTHLPLKAVSTAITQTTLTATLRVLHADLMKKFGIAAPRILVAGLNPHAGEGGHLGREEIDTISPVIESLRGEGLNIAGPLPADTLFTPEQLSRADAVLAMYHDQGLPVLKHASFGQGVNVTLGLPFIRTSVDHGTALDLAGTGNIDVGSMRAAIDLAVTLSKPSMPASA